MLISVIGCGYLGAVHAAGLAKLGHRIVGIDVDTHRIQMLARGEAPFFEAGFDDLLKESLEAGRLDFTTDIAAAAGCAVHFVCVGTPQRVGARAADLTAVHAAFGSLATAIADSGPCVVVGKSTVPVGTAARLAAKLALNSPDAVLVWNPEFLREGMAVQDTLRPDRIVYGRAEGKRGSQAVQILDEVYADALAAGTPRIETDYATAELVKVSANSFLALKVSFINAVATMCEAAGGDIRDLAAAIGHDERIGPKFLRAGIGFGGGCLPKDLRAYAARAAELEATGLVGLLDQVDAINLGQRDRMVAQVAALIAPGAVGSGPSAANLSGRTVGVLGAAFKPGTDDVRDSAALAVARALAAQGARVQIYDPAAGSALGGQSAGWVVADSPSQAATGADAVLVLTEWPEFVALAPAALDGVVARRLVIDGRNALDPVRWRQAGWEYHGVGVR